MISRFKILITIFIVSLLSLDLFDKLMSILEGNIFLYALVIGFLVYLLWLNIILALLSLPLIKSGVRWQRILGILGISVVVLDLFINIALFIWYFIR